MSHVKGNPAMAQGYRYEPCGIATSGDGRAAADLQAASRVT